MCLLYVWIIQLLCTPEHQALWTYNWATVRLEYSVPRSFYLLPTSPVLTYLRTLCIHHLSVCLFVCVSVRHWVICLFISLSTLKNVSGAQPTCELLIFHVFNVVVTGVQPTFDEAIVCQHKGRVPSSLPTLFLSACWWSGKVCMSTKLIK